MGKTQRLFKLLVETVWDITAKTDLSRNLSKFPQNDNCNYCNRKVAQRKKEGNVGYAKILKLI